MSGTVSVADTPRYIDVWIDSTPMVRLYNPDATVELSLDLKEVSCGRHLLLIGYNGKDSAAVADTFFITHPLYVSVTSDWEEAYHTDTMLQQQGRLHEHHPALRMTHFFGPYTFTDTSETRRQDAVTVDWLLSVEKVYGDEIGVHIHPWCQFVEYAGVTCRDTPTIYLDDMSDSSGYSVILASYTRGEMALLLAATAELFRENGLPEPVSFRAGGWSADTSTLYALADYGYLADCSAVNRHELEGYESMRLYTFQQQQWPDITGTSQPFIIEAPGGNTLLEIPDNGVLVDYVTNEDMDRIFRTLWTGGALQQPIVFSIGYHATNINNYVLFLRIDNILDELDNYLLEDGNGPVVYETVKAIAAKWRSF